MDQVGPPRDIHELEEALVQLHALERRLPGGGRWPFAGDGPWHLIQAEAGDYGGDGQDGASSSRTPRPPLDAAEVATVERMRRWVLIPVDVLDRKIVWEATAQLHARSADRVEWAELKEMLRYARTPRRLAQRYREAMGLIVCGLQGWPKRRAKELAR